MVYIIRKENKTEIKELEKARQGIWFQIEIF